MRSPDKPKSPSMPFVKQELSVRTQATHVARWRPVPRRGPPLHRQDSMRSVTSDEGSVRGGMRRGSFRNMIAPLHRQDSMRSMTSDEGSVRGGMRRGSFQNMIAMTEDGRRRLKLGRDSSLRTLKNIGAKAAAVAAVASPSYIAEVVTKKASPNLRSQGRSWNHWTRKYKAFDPRE